MKRDFIWLLALGIATAGGFWLGGAGETDGPLRSEFDRRNELPERRPAAAGSTDAPDPASLAAESPARSGAREVWEAKIGQPPTDEDWERIRTEAEAAREQYRRAAEMAEIAAAQRLAEERLAEQMRLEDAKRGGTMELLRGLREKPIRLPRLVADPEAFAVHFERRTPGPRTSGPQLVPGDEVADGSEIEFPAGVHVLDTRRLFGRDEPFPKDLLITGVGMDQTLLRIDEISTRSEVASLTFRDLTLDCNNNYMTDLRRDDPATIRLERCRVIGFDMGAGGSVMFAARAGALYASDCRFEAGYSRTAAGSGNLFRVRSGLLVRMQHCLFDGPFRSIYDSDNAATYHFFGCEIRDTKQHLARCKTDPRSGVTFEKCALVELAGDTGKILRSLADINPDWPARTR